MQSSLSSPTRSYTNSDHSVFKFIHQDGSETAIKVVKSCSNFTNESTGLIDTEWVDRDKYSIFISSSLGCYMACKFCHLTIKGSAYKKFQAEQIVANVKEAVLYAVQQNPGIKDRYVKLCWMGMGDAINQPDMVYDVTIELMDWLMANKYTVGLDCVDISTVLPKVNDSWVKAFRWLNDSLLAYPSNPKSFLVEQAELATSKTYTRRTPLRLFYSLHSAIQATRDIMVPNAMPLADVMPLLEAFQYGLAGPNLLLHTVFVEGLNDGPTEVDSLIDFLKLHFPNNELRILRYNPSEQSSYKEISGIDNAVQRIMQQHPLVKVQTSAGSDVLAACGQFIVAVPKMPRIIKTQP